MKSRCFFQNMLVQTCLILSLSGMPTEEVEYEMPTVDTKPVEETQSLSNKIRGFETQVSTTDKIEYLNKIMVENYGKTIPNEAKIEFRSAIIKIWNESWSGRNKANFSTVVPQYNKIMSFFNSIVTSYNNFIINNQFRTWLNKKSQNIKQWITQKKKAERQSALRKKGRRTK